MDIDRFNFWEKLPTILKTISEAQYVAVDLEMSGIKFNLMPVSVQRVQRTLIEAYNDARIAANMYSILQFGFTCISWEPEKNSYATKTYNLPLHPGVIGDNVISRQFVSVVDRCFRLSTKTLDFLNTNDFSLQDGFQRGVPFLSAGEFAQKETSDFIEGQRSTKSLIDDGGLPPKSVQFRHSVQRKIIIERDRRLQGGFPMSVEVYGSHGHRLNGLQKRLVRELLQDQYPELQAITRSEGTYMEIFQTSPQESITRRNARADTVFKQIGARLLWDAICGQPFVTNIVPRLIVGNSTVKVAQLRAELQKYEDRLQKKSPVLIGHNILMDLCFLRSNFVDLLSGNLQEFRALTRATLPRIVDTKYLFTRGGDEMSPDYSLAECFAAVRDQELPAVAPDPSHSYSEPCPHQAGYDSYMTAVVFLKKSYQLSQAGEGLQYIASEDLGVGEALPPMPYTSPNNLLEERDEGVRAALDKKYGVLQPEGRPTAPATAPPTPKQSRYRMLPGNTLNTFKMGSFSKSESPATGMPAPGMVPEWEGQFWSKYGNRSRVGQFGHTLYFGRMNGE